MTEARHPFGGAGDQRKPALRRDLRLVTETGADGSSTLRIVDPKSGKTYSFDAAEQALCRAADGQRDLSQIRAVAQADGGTLGAEDVAKFFRRLHVLGLLEPTRETPEAEAKAPPTSDLIARRRQEAAETADPPKMQRRAGPGALAGGRGKVPGGMRARLARPGDPETPTRREMLARRKQEQQDKPSDPASDAPRPGLAERRAKIAAARAAGTLASRGKGTFVGRTADAPSEGAPGGRALMERRRRDRSSAQDPVQDKTQDTTEGATKAPSQTARSLLQRRRDEAAEAAKPAPVFRDPLAERRAAVADGTMGDVGAAVPLPALPERPAGPAPAMGVRDFLAERRAQLIGPVQDTAEADAPATPEEAPATADPEPDALPAPANTTSDPAETPAEPKEAPRQAANAPTIPAGTGSSRPSDAKAEAPKAKDAPAADPKPATKAAPSAAEAAMAAARKAASAGTADSKAAPRTAPAKKQPRNSDLMVRRLRERSGRGIAPETGKPAGAADVAAATKRAAPAPVPQDDLDFDMLHGDGDDMGLGPMGGGARGAGMGRRGMMGGGMGAGGMGGGMGAGGMGGGMGAMGGGMRGMMAGGGMGAMGGGMGQMAAMRGQQPQTKAQRMPGQLPLFAPQPFLRLLYILFYPLKYVLWALVPLFLLAGMTAVQNLPEVTADVTRLASDFSSIAHLLVSVFGVSLMARLAQGVAIVAHGGRVQMFGIMLALGIIPRFTIDRSGIEALDRKGQLWAYGSPLLARLSAFSVFLLIWAMTRDRGGPLPDYALVLAQFGLVVFLITAWPLFLSDGQRWMSVLLNEPKLFGKAAMSIRHIFKGGDLPPSLSKNEVWIYGLFGLGTILTLVLLIGGVIYMAWIWLVGTYQGLGFLLLVAGLTSFSLWVSALLRMRKKNKGGGFDTEGFKQLVRSRGEFLQPEDPQAEGASLPSRAKVVWAMILCGLLAVAFLPYEYQTGGNVTILPLARGQAVARSEGEIVEILVSEGQVVTRGQTLAQLSSWDQQADISTTEAQLEGAQAELDRLVAGATPEEIDVARKELDSAEASVAFTQAEADRNRELAATGVVSQAALEKALSALEIDLADLEVARANYNKVVAPATEQDLAIARADVRRLEQQLSFLEGELSRTQVVAPIDGRVVTPDLQLKQGSYLRSGDVLLEIERTDIVTATILVTESDIGLITPGDTVRLKTAGQADQEVFGQVETIAPSATEEQGYGKAIRVTASFDNDDGFLRSGMTGYAKIDGEEMRVWEAYLRSIRHFFQIEVWSWIP